MSEIRYRAYRKKQPGGRYVWGVLRREGRKQNFRSVGEGEAARRKAEKLAKRLSRMEASSLDGTDRFLSWHRSGDPPPFDRTVRDYARTAKDDRSRLHVPTLGTALRLLQDVVAHVDSHPAVIRR